MNDATGTRDRNRGFKQNWLPLLLGAGGLVFAHYAALLFRIHPAVSLWFPPSGVAITLAIWFGPAAAIIAGLVSTILAPLWGSSGWMQWVGMTDAVEPFVAWWFYRQFWQRSLFLGRLKDVSAFILSAPVFACASSAVVGSLSLALTGTMSWQAVVNTIPHWWLGNAIATLVLAPIALLTLTPTLQRWQWLPEDLLAPSPRCQDSSRLRAEKIVIVGLCFAIALLSVSQTSQTGFAFQQFSFLNFVPILWAALRFGAVGGASTASLCVISALLSYVLKYPQALTLPEFPISSDVLTVHKLSLLTQCVIGLFTGTAITQQTQAQVKLAISQIQLAEYEARSRLNEILEQTNRTLAKTNAQLERTNLEKDQLLVREQATRSQAETANRIKDEFLAVVSHELRTPLNPILGWARLLQSGKLDASTTQKAIETIDRNARLQSQLIEDLLDVSRILRDKLVLRQIELEIGLVVRSAIETVRLSAEAKGISIAFSPPNSESRLLVHGDPNRLQQVVINLLTNAVKFTPQNGRVTIALEYPPNETLGFVQISVSDTGKGIHPDFLPHVFERFRQEDSGTTRNFGGLGLGLAIVRHLVELHQGKVEARSEGVDRGATFIVKLPVLNPSAELMPEVISLTPQVTGCLSGYKVLIVEDEADARELLRFILEDEQAIVSLSDSAQDAIAKFSSFAPDLIISDISMPGMDGYDFIQHIRAVESCRIPAIALTANAREEDRLSAIAAGFDAHIAKPIVLEVLFTEIKNLLQLACPVPSAQNRESAPRS
ncbi:MASE1 domain-containing protein [Cyanobacteria bacterium FACHB-DQ100]|nr:MASE1 domain-containing protein [Cyanobacteria bacterium FACHB-DQ100]